MTIRHSRRAATTLLLAGAIALSPACKDDPKPVAEASDAASPASAAASAAAAPTAAASATGSGSAAAGVAPLPPAKVSAADLTLHVAHNLELVWGAIEIGLFDVGRMVVMPGFHTLEGERWVAPPEDQHFEPDAFPGAMLDGSVTGANWLDARALHGKWPTEMWLTAEATFGLISPRVGYAQTVYVWQRQYGRWGRVKDQVVGAAAWNKTTLAYARGKGFLVGPGSKAKVPQQEKGTACVNRIDGKALATEASGAVWLLGTDCDDDKRLGLERWQGGGDEALVSSRRVALPGAPVADTAGGAWILPRGSVTYALVATDGGDAAWALRGEAVDRITLPTPKLKSAHAAADGALFVVADKGLYRYEGQGDGASRWSKLRTPSSKFVEVGVGVFAAGRDEVYLPVRVGPYQGYVLSSRAAAEADAPMLKELAAFEEEGRKAAATPPADGNTAAEVMAAFPELNAECKTPFVVFFPVVDGVPRTFAFPQTQSQLADYAGKDKLRVVDFVWQGRRFVGGAVADATTAAAVKEHWNARDKQSPSRTACHAPPDTARTVTIP
jgi:hypothetical protein